MRGERGQAGIEFALLLPLLLVVLLGITDFGRAFYYSSAVASAAHSGAAAYAIDPNADVNSAACGALGSLCEAAVVKTGCPGAPAVDAAVKAIYHFELFSGFLVSRIPTFDRAIFGSPTFDLRACATYPRIS